MKITNKEYKEFYNNFFYNLLKDSKKNFYDESALPSYTHKNSLMSFLFWNRINTALNLLRKKDNFKVLDFGCGGGVTFRYLTDKNCEITGCDNEHYNLAKIMAKTINKKIKIVSDIEKIKNEKFDVILALDVLEHIDDISKILKRFEKLLGPNGIIIVSGPTENIFYKLGRILAGFSGHYHVSNIYHIEKEFKKASFQRKFIKSLYYPVPLFRISLWIKK
ncbi:MAG: class I SAM-dependent methyltransferase [Spirochaetia bacterium]|nr:class I SAM-dependent methyltransferase [Spirochaetia bacterium]